MNLVESKVLKTRFILDKITKEQMGSLLLKFMVELNLHKFQVDLCKSDLNLLNLDFDTNGFSSIGNQL